MKNQTYSCGLEAALEVVGGKWKVLVLWHLVPANPTPAQLAVRQP
jgi:DNA-binding HxlR family transcriptional regulator